MTVHPHASRLVRACLLISLLALTLMLPTATAAQDDRVTVIAADPRANAVLADPPETLVITFSTAVDPAASTVRIVGEDGRDLAGIDVAWPAPDTATVTMPADLPNGSWLAAWGVAAAEGGATGAGFFGFTIGTDQDVAPLTIPDTGFADTRLVVWATAAALAAILLGVFLLVAIWPVRLLIRGPSGSWVTVVAIAGAALGGIGALARIGTLAWASPAASWPDRLGDALGGGDGGALLALLTLIAVHALAMALVPSTAARSARIVPWLTTVALPVPVVPLSHAADEPAGRVPAMTTAWVAIVALSLLAGGPAAVLAARPRQTGGFLPAVGAALPALAVSGAYLLWLFTGNRAAIESTAYGTAAVVAVLLIATLAVTLVAALLVGRTRSSRLLVVPAFVGVALAVACGSLITVDTARAELTRETIQRAVPLTLDGERAQLILAPGTAGVNHVRLELDQPSLPRQATATLAMSLPSRPDLGTATVPLSRMSDAAFEYHGTELSVAATWDVRVEVTEPGGAPAGANLSLAIGREVTRVDLPAVPWRFADFAGSAGIALGVIGIAGIVAGVAAGRTPLRRESTGMGIVALALAAILLGQGRLDPILAAGGGGDGAINPDDLGMITRGEAIYTEHCLSCHGAELRGDGPAAEGMQPPPADFAAPHTMVHDEAALIYWLRHGKQGTAMPAFGDRLTDQEIADVLSYIERAQREMRSP